MRERRVDQGQVVSSVATDMHPLHRTTPRARTLSPPPFTDTHAKQQSHVPIGVATLFPVGCPSGSISSTSRIFRVRQTTLASSAYTSHSCTSLSSARMLLVFELNSWGSVWCVCEVRHRSVTLHAHSRERAQRLLGAPMERVVLSSCVVVVACCTALVLSTSISIA